MGGLDRAHRPAGALRPQGQGTQEVGATTPVPTPARLCLTQAECGPRQCPALSGPRFLREELRITSSRLLTHQAMEVAAWGEWRVQVSCSCQHLPSWPSLGSPEPLALMVGGDGDTSGRA